ncbi:MULTISPECIES: shikimate kinase [unclassified Arthrobacter]|uniref:shikimate kinase n=1 Tax=unclassified Arthrobacter TaxID=235627 RepID=UPI00159DDDE0|nr:MULTISPECIES: shikimate kinase [unclassified Arthrobacter]MCQ9164374.1 shikimate kinase [Arthrobacter sp. STN4]NVM97918.1 shikimate kinase [Arthrobacter sp. SDTb3-6]
MAAGTGPSGEPQYRPERPIAMIGPMAVGKSVIGAELARKLGIDFVDTDQRIVARHGAIPRIFASRGERHFRQLEARAVADVLDTQQPKAVVLSLGGGAVLDTGTQQLLARATVVFLRATVETVKDRIIRNTGRPLLAADPLAAWSRLAAARGPVYDRLADLTLDVGKSSVPELVDQLVALLAAESRKENTAP